MANDCTDIDIVLRQINQRLRRSRLEGKEEIPDASTVSLTRKDVRYII